MWNYKLYSIPRDILREWSKLRFYFYFIKWALTHSFRSSTLRSSRPEVFQQKGVLKICRKFTGDHPCQTVILIKLLSNLLKSHSAWVFSCKFAAYFQNTLFSEYLWTAASVLWKVFLTRSFRHFFKRKSMTLIKGLARANLPKDIFS